MSDVEVVNVVSSCNFGVELDLGVIADDEGLLEDPRIESLEHSLKSGERLLVRFPNKSALTILSRKGTCIITGAGSEGELQVAQDQIKQILLDHRVIESKDIVPFEIQNMVCTAELHKDIDLNQMMVILGFESTEYEPEQFPGLIYRPEDNQGVILIFNSGKIVITGVISVDQASKNLRDLIEQL